METKKQMEAAQKAQLAADEVIHERQLQIRGFFDAASVAMVLLDPKGRFVRTNAAFRDLFNYSFEELRHRSLLDFAAPQSQEALSVVLSSLERGERVRRELEARLLNRDSEPVWVHLSLAAFGDEDDRVQGVTLHVADIRQRKVAESRLQHSERRFQELLAHTPAGILELSPDGQCRFVNLGWTKLSGFCEEDSVGRGWTSALHHEDRDASVAALGRAIETRAALCHELRLMTAHGRILWVSLTGGAIVDEDGEYLGYLAAVVDVTERVETSRQLVAAKEAAERANAAKADFLAKMSHEIRTPMNSILGMTEMTLTTRLNAEQRAYLDLVQSSGKALLRLIDDILDFSRSEASRVQLERVSFDLHEFFAVALRPFAHQARDKGLELVLRFIDGTPRRVIGDPHRLRQILVNLIANAVKFTREGEIIVEVAGAADEPSGKLTLFFKVIDTGPGIGEEEQKRIFQAFTQETASVARRYGGAGLGLAICSQLVELMQGEIWVESRQGEGSTFFVTLGTLALDSQVSESIEAPYSSGHASQILVLERHEPSREVTRKMLEGLGHTPVIVACPREALEYARAVQREGGTFLAAVLDLDRWDESAERFVDQLERINGTLGIVRLSPSDGSESQILVDKSVSLYKPVLPDELRRALVETTSPLSDRSRQSLLPPTSLRPAARSLRVLVADDNATNQQVISTMLERLGHEAEMVENGQEALTLLLERNFDLVLMDVQMPVLNGLEAVRLLRAREKLRGDHLPVVALTAQAMQGDREDCLRAGMDEYLSKPVNLPDLARVIDICVDGCGPTSSVPASITPGSIRDAAGSVDLQTLRKRIGHCPAALQKISELFERDSLRLVQALRDSVEKAGPPHKSTEAHTLKGMLRNVCAFESAKVAESIERLTRNGQWKLVEPAVCELERAVQKIALELRRAAQKEPEKEEPAPERIVFDAPPRLSDLVESLHEEP